MERKRVAGRFVRAGLDGDGGAEAGGRKSSGAAPRPKQCRTFTRKKVAEALPEIVETFVEEAKKGSIAHAKMLAALGGLDKAEKGEGEAPKKRRGKSAMTLLLESISRKPEQK
ncbi:MAG: hypothetical protein WDN23_17720 [Edaphobacter sp.]